MIVLLRCYLDTNVLIHFQRFDTLDWHSILETREEVTLVVAPIVLRELNKKKDSDQNKGIRIRAGDILKAFEKYQENGKIREGVFLNFVCIEPKIDWDQKGLDPDVSDDRLIASMILEEDISKLILVTSDFGLRQKARNKNIRNVKLDDSLKEDVRIDDDTKKIKELEAKLARFENASPKLDLYVKSSPDAKFHEFELKEVKGVDPSIIEEKIERLKTQLEYKNILEHRKKLGIVSLGWFDSVSDDEIDRYEKEVDDYLVELREYYGRKNRYENYKSRLFCLDLVITNVGKKVALDIDVFLHFPDGFSLIDEEEACNYHEPSLPARPTPPRTSHELFTMPVSRIDPGIYSSLMSNIGNSAQLRLGVDYSLESIKKTQSYDVHFQVKKLKHNMQMELDSIYLLFDSYGDIKPFSFDYVINVENHPDEFGGKYHIKFKPVE
nr:PIN domain-containing protein [uncultured Sphaerochaeta sp.]